MRVGDDAASAATVRQLDACCLDWHDGATHAGTGDVRTKCGLAVKSNVLVMDLALNGISGVDVYRQIRCRNASLGIVGVNSYPLDQYRQQLASAGAQGLFSRRDIFSPALQKLFGRWLRENAPIARAIFFQRENLMSIFASFPKRTNGVFPIDENSTYFLCTQKD